MRKRCRYCGLPLCKYKDILYAQTVEQGLLFEDPECAEHPGGHEPL